MTPPEYAEGVSDVRWDSWAYDDDGNNVAYQVRYYGADAAPDWDVTRRWQDGRLVSERLVTSYDVGSTVDTVYTCD